MEQSISLNSQNRYEIKVHGQLDESWLGWFGDAKVCVETLADNDQVTTFSDIVMDQAGLVGFGHLGCCPRRPEMLINAILARHEKIKDGNE